MMLDLTVTGDPGVTSGVGAGESLLARLRDSLSPTGTNARRANGAWFHHT